MGQIWLVDGQKSFCIALWEPLRITGVLGGETQLVSRLAGRKIGQWTTAALHHLQLFLQKLCHHLLLSNNCTQPLQSLPMTLADLHEPPGGLERVLCLAPRLSRVAKQGFRHMCKAHQT